MSEIFIHHTHFTINWPAVIVVGVVGLTIAGGFAWIIVARRDR